MRFLSVFSFLFFVLFSTAGHAGDTVRDQQALDHGLVRIFAEYDALVPGQTQYLAVEVTPEEGWHSYWFNPGDSGLAPEIDWTLPDGVQAGEMLLPAPVRLRTDGFTNYGFARTMTIMVPITASGQIVSPAAPIKADARFLLCADICVPYNVTLALSLPVRENANPVNQRYLAGVQASWPQPSPWRAEWRIENKNFQLSFAQDRPPIPESVTDLWFYVRQPGLTAHDGKATIATDPDGIMHITLPAGDGKVDSDDIQGVLFWQVGDQTHNYWIRAVAEAAVPSASVPLRNPVSASYTIGLGVALLLAFFGGALLNFMPCVFPVLALKIMAFVRHHESRHLLWQENLGYGSGIMTSFLALGGVMMVLRGAGAAIGWGFQLQEPLVIWGLLVLFLVLALALAFDLSLGGFGIEDSNPHRQPGFGRGFATGMLVAVVASPCTAPMMAAALGAALVMPVWQGGLVFLALGLGLALPMVMITLVPGLARFVPRPGAWMGYLRQAMAFPMIAAALWLLWVLTGQVDRLVQGWVLGLLLLIALVLWVMTLWPRARLLSAVIIVFISCAGGSLVGGALWLTPPISGTETASGTITWQSYDPARVETALSAGQSVFVDATADWCITCLVNERTALSSKAVLERFAADNILLLRADWTRRDPVVTKLLEQHGRAGVPLYVLYHPGQSPIVLPQILTEKSVFKAIDLRAIKKK